MTARITIRQNGWRYPVLVGDGLLGEAGRLIANVLRPRLACIVTDRNVAPLYLALLASSLEAAGIATRAITLPAGEHIKSFAHLERLCERLLKAGVGREDAVAALGGGVVGDLAGLAASLVHRGVPFVNCPTTLLAQVDASIGGKTAVSTPLGKNLVGSFHPPALVIADTALLSTLPRRELCSGYAEMVKHAVIAGGRAFTRLERRGDLFGLGLTEMVAASIRIKGRIVSADPNERGRRAVLNLGHTFGHAIEGVAGYTNKVTHGEAVAVGIVLAFRYAVAQGKASEKSLQRVEAALKRAGLPVSPSELPLRLSAKALMTFIRRDKKARLGNIRLIVPHAIGKVEIEEVTPATLTTFLTNVL